jgi:hypothetical protein
VAFVSPGGARPEAGAGMGIREQGMDAGEADAAGPEDRQRPIPRLVEVGWFLDNSSAQFIWDAPRRVTRARPERRHAKSLSQCPAVTDMDARLFEVRCPIDLAIGFKLEDDKPVLRNLAGDQSTIRSKHLNQMLALVDRKEWADPQRPVLQIPTPYVFVADEPVFVNQLPPFYHYRREPWPGVLVGGRFPIDVWPRQLMWAIEWHDLNRPLVLRRGEPWFYVRFEHFDPARAIRMVEAEVTGELREYMRGLSGVANYVNQTFKLFDIARERRPARLLTPKVRAGRKPPEDDLSPAATATLAAEEVLVRARAGDSGEPIAGSERLHPPVDPASRTEEEPGA